MCGNVLSLLRIPSVNVCGDTTVLKASLAMQPDTELVLRGVPTHTDAFYEISKQLNDDNIGGWPSDQTVFKRHLVLYNGFLILA